MLVVERTEADVLALHVAGGAPQRLEHDGAKWAGVRVDKPWGHEVEIYRAGAVSITRLSINPGAETSLHCHLTKDALLLVEDGICNIEFLGHVAILGAGECVHIKRGVFHRTRTEKGATVIEVEAPANKCDLVRIGDRYGRAGLGY